MQQRRSQVSKNISLNKKRKEIPQVHNNEDNLIYLELEKIKQKEAQKENNIRA